MLYIVNKSPFTHTALLSCLRYLPQEGVVLLIEDGVIAAANNTQSHLLKDLAQQGRVFALSEDIKARGLEGLLAGVKQVNYGGFVDLTITYGTAISWF